MKEGEEMDGIFECNEKITVLDVGQNYKITDKGFIRILQEAANLASSQVGHGIADIERTGTTCVILYWRLKVYKRAGYNDTLNVKTWANFYNKIYSLREFEVLRYLANQPGQVVTREALLEKVWGYEYYGDIRTVDVTIRRIREKIEQDTSSPKLLITKRGVGYYLSSKERDEED